LRMSEDDVVFETVSGSVFHDDVSIEYSIEPSMKSKFCYIVSISGDEITDEEFAMWCDRINSLVNEVGVDDGDYLLYVLTNELFVAEEIARTAAHDLCIVLS